jgi:predicted metalloprotease with PDZ domain
MLTYTFSYQNPVSHLVTIQLQFKATENTTELALPAWRPGRYEIQNFAKNIISIEAFSSDNKNLPIRKISKDSWIVESNKNEEISIKYVFFAFQMDAGGSWLDENQLYINFINCAIYPKNEINTSCKVHLILPKNYQIACGLKEIEPHVLFANSYYELVDSPFIASATLQKISYQYQNHQFNLWFQGNVNLENTNLIKDFEAFTKSNIAVFGEFPCPDYHFIFQILPYKHYHGVEHRNSTMIVLGPDSQFETTEFIHQLLGVSCHELFHTWNVIRLRPKEMTPYNFQQENYFNTGYAIEGITTYYGELLLARSGVFSTDQFLAEFHGIFRNHFENFGYLNASLADSSIDAWLDGYQPNTTNRRVSIYHKGAIVAFLLDIELRKCSNNIISLDTVMKRMWERYGKNEIGYLHQDFVNCVNEVSGADFDSFFNLTIFQKTSLLPELKTALQWLGCSLETNLSPELFEQYYGGRLAIRGGKYYFVLAEPNSPASIALVKDDELIAIDNITIENNINSLLEAKSNIILTVIRNHKQIEIRIEKGKKTYFNRYTINYTNANENFTKWIGKF